MTIYREAAKGSERRCERLCRRRTPQSSSPLFQMSEFASCNQVYSKNMVVYHTLVPLRALVPKILIHSYKY